MLQSRGVQLQSGAQTKQCPAQSTVKASRTRIPAKTALTNHSVAMPVRTQHALNFHAVPKRCVQVAVSGLSEAAPGKIKLGFAGIGIMGNAMVANLIRAGYEVHVWNRNAAKCEPLIAMGAKV
ncbi:hypothetical protein DUNSADRAFT_14016 [Dunaliella salina]|uniref:6-phosphogluconate dehydrogenase NADP-binding domain-containing protein n=1 Tax=Dunaliella salina TaxID=3046 RepID=A0ABQ7H301_DUNSA|nr:hypothetical protein DUNSADRAFT_14016 [Dunaliella salina]|eukprot:KAF5841185.1 hypothetical protein DUNSADRAFT_14016 [Dunaliella salina]